MLMAVATALVPTTMSAYPAEQQPLQDSSNNCGMSRSEINVKGVPDSDMSQAFELSPID